MNRRTGQPNEHASGHPFAAARIELLDTGESFLLSPRHVIGRAHNCSLRLEHPSISGYHAEIIWDGRRWNVQDLGSRNGTMLGTRQLVSGERVPLERRSELVLAGSTRLRLLDDSPPTLQATTLEGDLRIAEHGILSLPDDEEPEVTIYRYGEGEWMVEARDGSTSPAQPGQTIQAGGRLWQLSLPTLLPETREVGVGLRIQDVEFRFYVSRDGEHVSLELHPDQGAAMTVETRAHLGLLMMLARTRLNDMAANQPASECGWLHRDVLPRMLGVREHMLNLWTHRARKQLAALGLCDAAEIIERRSNATQVRIASARLRVIDA